MSRLSPYPAGIPFVTTTAQRDTWYPNPDINFRVDNGETGQLERWTGTAWIPDLAGYGPVFNVLRFGAKPDGTTDNQAAFAAATAALTAAGGGTLYVPRAGGIYQFASRWLMDADNVRIVGDGDGTMLRLASATTLGALNVMAVIGSNVIVEGMQLISNGKSNGVFAGETLLVSAADHVTLRDLTLDHGGTGNLTINGVTSLLAQRIRSTNVDPDSLYAGNPIGIFVYQGTSERLTFTDIEELSAHTACGFGIITQTDGGTVTYVTYRNCFTRGSSANGNAHGFIAKQDANGGAISAITYDTCQAVDHAGMGFYAIGDTATSRIRDLRYLNCLADNCLTTGTGGTLVDGVFGMQAVEDVVILAPTIRNGGAGASSRAIRIDGAGVDDGSRRITIQDAAITLNANLTIGILLQNRIWNARLLHNSVDLGGIASAVGLYTTAATGTNKDLLFDGNHVKNGGASSVGVRLDTGTTDAVVTNTITRDLATGIQGVTGLATSVVFGEGNRHYGTGNPQNMAAVQTVVRPGMSGDRGDTANTIVWNTDAEVQRFATPITALRNQTLSTAVTPPIGVRFRLVRVASATGAFNVACIGAVTVNLAAPIGVCTWCEFEFDGTAWQLAGAGSL